MTATLAEPTHGELPTTATYTRRRWQWLPAYPGEVGDGTLEICLTTGRRQPKTEFHRYAVQIVWDECDAEAGVWVFILENLDKPDADGPFQCVVGGTESRCGCEAAKYRLGCKHRDSLLCLTKEVL